MARAPVRRLLQPASSDPAGRRQGLQFFRETAGELKRVVWPTREQTTRLTILVIVISVFVGMLLGVVDMVFGRLFGFLV